MKKTLLLLFACLFGALSGVKAWTSVDPVVNRWYLLYNINTHNYWYGTNATYGDVDNLANATPIKLESGYKLAFICGSTTYRIYHTNGTKKPERTDGVNFTLEGNATGQYGYQLKSKNTDHDRWMCPGGSFEQQKNIHDRDWQFFAYEEVLPSIVEAKAPTCASTAEASYVSGWERVTTKEQLAQNPERYFYAIFSAVNPGVMMTTEYNDNQYRMCYKAAGNPLSNSSYDLFEMENYDGEFAIKSNITGKYYGNTSGDPWDFLANKETLNEGCKVTVTCSNGVYNLQDRYDKGQDEFVGNYLGAWDNMEFVGERLAGNKSIKRAGYFLIYRKLKKNVDLTSRITNHSFETGNGTGWNVSGCSGSNVEIVYPNTDAFNGKDGTYFAERYQPNGTVDINQTITGLPAGTYRLTVRALARGAISSAKIYANSSEKNITIVDAANEYSVDVIVPNSAANLKVGLNAVGTASGDNSWLAFDNFRLTYLGVMATEADYTVLQNAINNAEAKNLGFDNGEYAPYNNVAVLNALADANAIDPSADNLQIDVQNATNALTSKSWTVNSGKVNAFYKGDFDGYDEDDQSPLDYTPNGWTATDNFRLMLKNTTKYPGLADASATAAVMVWSGGITYGETEGYTMPLKANTIYKLKFKAAGWNNEDRSGMIVSVLNSGDGLAATDLGTPNRDIKGNETNVPGMTSFERLFRTGAAGNYLFHIQSGHNIVATDFELMTVPSTVPATIGENGYTTFASTYPLDLTQANLPVGVKAYKATSINSSYVHFEKLDQVVPANTGVLLEGGVGVKNIRVAPEDEVAEVTDNLFLVNESNDKFSPEANTTYYAMVKNSDPMTFGKFDPSVVAVPNYKAYLAVTGGSARLTVMFDGEDPTAINAIEAAEAEDGALKDGKYIIDNKVVIVKNGVKYSANGQKLN